MIGEGATDLTLALSAALGDDVAVYPSEPETAAAPCVWLAFLEARYLFAHGWTITYEATVVADAGLGPIDAQAQLGEMTDAVLTMDASGVVATDMTARGGGLTARIGDVAHPCHIVTIPQVTKVC